MNYKYRNVVKVLANEQMVSMGISGTYETLAGRAPLQRNGVAPPEKEDKKKIKKHYGKRKIPIKQEL